MRPQFKFLFKTPKVFETSLGYQVTISYMANDIEDAENWINKALDRAEIFSSAEIDEFKNFSSTSFKGSTVVKKIEIPRIARKCQQIVKCGTNLSGSVPSVQVVSESQ